MTRLPSHDALLVSAPSHPLHTRELCRDDLIGLLCVSYLRFSSKPQEKGNSIDRQQAVLVSVVKYFQLVRDRALEDRGFSASKNHHRKFGQPGVLLKMVEDGEIDPAHPTVLVIEATDRLFRSGNFDAMDVLKKLVCDGGMILVIGRNLSIWNYYAINESMRNVALQVEINMGREVATRLRDFALGSHAKKREQMEELVSNPEAKKPKLAGRRPGWIVWDDGIEDYALHPVHTETVRLIFRLYIAGYSTKPIAYKLNADERPVLGDKLRAGRLYTDWRATNVGRILRDESVLGLVQPHHMVTGERQPIGSKSKVYPAAIEAADWLAVQETLDGRRTLRGRKGKLVANIFTGHVLCGVCSGAMRVDAGGSRKDRIRKFQCSAYVEGRSCQHATRYDVPVWEPLIVDQIIERSAIVPRSQGNGQGKQADELAAARLETQQLEEQVNDLEGQIGKSPTKQKRWNAMCEKLDALQKRIVRLELEVEAAKSTTSRHRDVARFMRELRGPALCGDADARERLRSLLSRVDFKVVFGGTIPGGIDLTIRDWSDSFEP